MIVRREDFGNIKKLTKGSHKKVWVTCDICGVGLLREYKIVNKQNIHKCQKCHINIISKDKSINESRRKKSQENWQKQEYRDKVCPKISEKKKEWWGNKSESERVALNKTPYSELKETVDKAGYILITTQEEWETKTHIKPRVRCERHQHEFNFRKISGCAYCAGRKIYLPLVEKQCSDIGYKLISVNGKYIEFICNNGHRCKVKYGNWKDIGSRCPYCKSEYKIHIDTIINEIKEYGLELLEIPIKYNSETKLQLRCATCKHTFKSSILDLRRCVNKCAYCHHLEKYSKIKEMVEKEGYYYLNFPYGESLKFINFICPNGHTHRMTVGNWTEGQRCLYCYYDKVEQESKERQKHLKGKMLYYELVALWTNRSKAHFMYMFNPDGVEINWNNTIDHKYSQIQGYRNGIPPWIIGSPINLEVMDRSLNNSKNYKCSISKRELYKRFDGFIKENEYLTRTIYRR